MRYEPPGSQPTTAALLEVFSYGVLLHSASLAALSPRELWEPGHVAVTSDDITFVDVPRLCRSSDEWLCQDEPGTCPML